MIVVRAHIPERPAMNPEASTQVCLPLSARPERSRVSGGVEGYRGRKAQGLLCPLALSLLSVRPSTSLGAKPALSLSKGSGRTEPELIGAE